MKKFLETQSEVDIAKADIKIENDPELQKLAQDKFRIGVIESQIDPRIDDEGDRQRAVELEKKKMDLADKIESEKLDTNKKIFEQELIEFIK